ncbi:MAG: glycosyltransferase family 2 protein [Candidatus Zixiibacteriota bacterium]|nr:MAG: glycosyltransferase family 2 protein [candidate division Zixibacteria bacterium]
MSPGKNSVSVIIVTHNSMPLLEECLANLKAAMQGIPGEIVAVDNNSVDHSATVVVRYFPKAKVIVNRDNPGFGTACNQAAQRSSGEFLLFLNPDVLVDQDAIRNLRAVFSARDRIGLAGARLRHPSGMFQPTCRKFPTISNLVYSRGSVIGQISGSRSQRPEHIYTLPDYDQTTIVDAVAGTMSMVRRDLFEKIGGFDERFFLFMEDTDLSLRLNRQGYVNVFVPAAGGVHHWGRGSRSGHAKRQWYQHRSVWKFFRKHHEDRRSLAVLALLLSVNLPASLVFGRPRRERT